MGKLHDISEIVDLLTARIESLAADILPLGRREGHDWVDANVAKGGLGDSMRVCLTGARRGVFKHFASSDKRAGGDALELIAYVCTNGDKGKAIEFARRWLGLDTADPNAIKQECKKAAAQRKSAQEKEQERREGTRKFAHAMWLEAVPIAGTMAEAYLHGRGIDFTRIGHMSGALRFAPKCKHQNGNYYPAMVAAITRGDGTFAGVHRTYLHRQGGQVIKVPGIEAKLVLGSYAGGVIALNRGQSGKKLRDAPENDQVVLCEGIEDGLSLAMACPAARVLACISVSNFKNAPLPSAIRDVTLAVDNDPEYITVQGIKKPHPARVSVQKAVDHFIDQGRVVRIARADGFKDFNDMLRGMESHIAAREGVNAGGGQA